MSEGTGSVVFLTLLVVLFAVCFLLPHVGRASGHGREAGKQPGRAATFLLPLAGHRKLDRTVGGGKEGKSNEERHWKAFVRDHSSLVALLWAGSALAQTGRGPGSGRGMRGRLYDTATEITVNGTVEEVQLITPGQRAQGNQGGPMCGMCPRGWTGTHLSLKTNAGTMIVHVGPAPYLKSKNFNMTKNDELTITGSKVQYQGADFLIAREIKKGDQTLTLRDANGFPLWAGRGRARSPGNPGMVN